MSLNILVNRETSAVPVGSGNHCLSKFRMNDLVWIIFILVNFHPKLGHLLRRVFSPLALERLHCMELCQCHRSIVKDTLGIESVLIVRS